MGALKQELHFSETEVRKKFDVLKLKLRVMKLMLGDCREGR